MSITPIRIVDVNSTSDFFERTEILKSYYDEIKNFPILSKDDEYKLFDKYFNGNKIEKEKARTKIINHNLKFVVSVAKKYAKNENIMDMIEEGTMGLIEAIDSFDYTKGYKFISYAVHYIRRAINQYRVNFDDMVIRTNYNKTFHLITKAKNEFIQLHHRQPTSEELKDMLNDKYGLNIKNDSDVMDVRTISIDVNFDSDDDIHGDEYTDYNSATSNENFYESISDGDYNKELIANMLAKLPNREQTIIKMTFGIGYSKEYELQEIAEELSLTSERVRQLKFSAFEKLKEYYEYYINKI